MDKQQLEAIRARDEDDYATAEVLRNIQWAGNTDPELTAIILMVADRHALLAAYDALAAENTALQRRIALQKGEPTPEQINHFIECAAIELAHARTFVTSRQKMHPDGVEMYDMTLNSARAIRDALRAADSASNREIAHDE